MSENQKRILQMLAEGKVTVEEATRLLSLVSSGQESPADGTATTKAARPTPKYLYVRVEPKEGRPLNDGRNSRCAPEHGKVNVRIPVGLIRAGMKLRALVPAHVADDVNEALEKKGIHFDIRDLKDEYIDELVAALSESEINVDSEDAVVSVRAE